jgi:hypothetical protein
VTALSYYGKPIVKEPVWKWFIPAYFFAGGAAGGTALLRLGARITGNDVLARRATWVNAAAIGVSPALLIADLGRPMRFLNMMRVFKVTSPMSVGTWILSASGAASTAGAFCELFGVLPRVGFAAETSAGALAPFLSTYTAALISDSVVPVWHDARLELPFEFAASSAAAAGGLTAMITPPSAAGPARRLGIAGGLLEVATVKVFRKRLGPLGSEPYRRGKAARLDRLSTMCALGGAGLLALAGRRRGGAVAGGALLAAGSALQRFAVVEAGRISARDPKYTTLPQRERAAAHGHRVQTRK